RRGRYRDDVAGLEREVLRTRLAHCIHVDVDAFLRAAGLGAPDGDAMEIGGIHRPPGGGEAPHGRRPRREVIGAGLPHPAVEEVLPAVHDDRIAPDPGQVERVLLRRLPLSIDVELYRCSAGWAPCRADGTWPPRSGASSRASARWEELHRAAGVLVR